MFIAAVLIGGCHAAEVPAPPQSLEVDPEGPRLLRTTLSTEAAEVTGPNGTPFSVELRTPRLSAFPCASCHEGTRKASATPRQAHDNIEPHHPKALGSRCATCHDPANFERLSLQDGRTASLDEAYRLCAQCHFQQAGDWAAGAHGKRIGGWRGKRVVMSCTSCHNPHAPSLPKRMPVEFPRIPHTTPLERLPAGIGHSLEPAPGSGH